MELAAVAFFTKPVENDDLIELICQTLAGAAKSRAG